MAYNNEYNLIQYIHFYLLYQNQKIIDILSILLYLNIFYLDIATNPAHINEVMKMKNNILDTKSIKIGFNINVQNTPTIKNRKIYTSIKLQILKQPLPNISESSDYSNSLLDFFIPA